jgi:hypothetical protein
MQLTSAPSPALDFIRRNEFLTKPSKHEPAAVLRMQPAGPDTVELIVNDPWAEDPEYADPNMYADTAASVLEPVVNGVKLIVKTEAGYVGQAGYFSGDEQYFANTLPGVTSQAAEVTYDLNGDGQMADDEAAFLFPVQSKADIARLDPLIKEQIGDYPVRYEVDPSDW